MIAFGLNVAMLHKEANYASLVEVATRFNATRSLPADADHLIRQYTIQARICQAIQAAMEIENRVSHLVRDNILTTAILNPE